MIYRYQTEKELDAKHGKNGRIKAVSNEELLDICNELLCKFFSEFNKFIVDNNVIDGGIQSFAFSRYGAGNLIGLTVLVEGRDDAPQAEAVSLLR